MAVCYYERFGPLWPGMKAGSFVGSGSFGNVWELIDTEGSSDVKEVVKEVLVPAESAGGLDEALLQGLDYQGAFVFYEYLKQRALDETIFMMQLASCNNIVNIIDYKVRELDESRGEIGWVIFIRMESLQPLKAKLIADGITPYEVGRLGIGICRALELCQEHGILHRDIKPENLFYSPSDDDFKLGDFGFSTKISRPTEGKGLPGTLTHMSPQVFRGGQFTFRDDLYALAIVMYKLLNDNRVPFLPPFPEPFSPNDRDEALARRLQGETPQEPSRLQLTSQNHPTLRIDSDSEECAVKLAHIATRGISPNLDERFASATAFREEIERVLV